jgi:hypothetical protein
MNLVNIQNINSNSIKKTIRSNKKLSDINQYITSHYKPLRSIGTNYTYIFDVLNIEGGYINDFKKIKILLEQKKHKNKKILLIARSPMQVQSADEKTQCTLLTNIYKKIKILYIHTHLHILNKKTIALVTTCKNNQYCTKNEMQSSKKNKRLCTTPILKIIKRRPVHAVCEIDDLLVLYYALINPNSKIVSKTEKYHERFDKNNIHHIKLFLNIPISVYSYKINNNRSTYNKMHYKYINPLTLLPKFIKAYNSDRITSRRNISTKYS